MRGRAEVELDGAQCLSSGRTSPTRPRAGARRRDRLAEALERLGHLGAQARRLRRASSSAPVCSASRVAELAAERVQSVPERRHGRCSMLTRDGFGASRGGRPGHGPDARTATPRERGASRSLTRARGPTGRGAAQSASFVTTRAAAGRAPGAARRARSRTRPARWRGIGGAAAACILDGIHEPPVLREREVQVRAGREAGRAHVADHLLLAHALAELEVRVAREVGVPRHEAVLVADLHRSCRSRRASPGTSRGRSPRPRRACRWRRVVDAEVRAAPAE